MGIYLNPGNDGFQSIVKGLYVDKTGLLGYINSVIGTYKKLICVSRPRRFGKSFAAKMLCAYYDRSCDSRALFDGLAISKVRDFEEHLNYWTQTEAFTSLSMYIEMDFDGLKEAIMDMLSGRPCRINPIGFQNDMVTLRNKDEILTLLVHLGYLTFDSSDQTVTIPNEEIRLEFLYTIENGKHRELYRIIENSQRLLENTIAMNADEVAAAIQSAHSLGTAPTFYNNEQSLRSVIRFAYICCVDEYQEIQELPSGTGYADLVYIPKKNSPKPAMIIELKWNKTANAAIDQIKSRNYPEVLKGYTEDILLVGINYDEKTKEHNCRIEWFN